MYNHQNNQPKQTGFEQRRRNQWNGNGVFSQGRNFNNSLLRKMLIRERERVMANYPVEVKVILSETNGQRAGEISCNPEGIFSPYVEGLFFTAKTPIPYHIRVRGEIVDIAAYVRNADITENGAPGCKTRRMKYELVPLI